MDKMPAKFWTKKMLMVIALGAVAGILLERRGGVSVVFSKIPFVGSLFKP